MLPHKKDGEQETANNFQFHGTFNLADRQNTDSQAGDSGLARYAGVQPGDQLPCGAPVHRAIINIANRSV